MRVSHRLFDDHYTLLCDRCISLLNLYIVFLVRFLIVLCFVCIYVVNQLVKVDIWTKDVAFVWKGPK